MNMSSPNSLSCLLTALSHIKVIRLTIVQYFITRVCFVSPVTWPVPKGSAGLWSFDLQRIIAKGPLVAIKDICERQKNWCLKSCTPVVAVRRISGVIVNQTTFIACRSCVSRFAFDCCSWFKGNHKRRQFLLTLIQEYLHKNCSSSVMMMMMMMMDGTTESPGETLLHRPFLNVYYLVVDVQVFWLFSPHNA